MSSSTDCTDGNEDSLSVDDAHCYSKKRCHSQKVTSGVILAAIWLSVFGSGFSSFLPAAIQHTIVSVMRIDITQYELFYSFYYWPNIVLVLIGGVLVDKVLGLRVGYITSLVLAVVGTLLLALGGFFDRYWLMMMGRLLHGTGNLMVILTTDAIMAHLFKKQLSLVVSIIYCANYLGKSLCFELAQYLYDTLKQRIFNSMTCLGLVLLLGFVLCVIGLLSGIAAAILYYKREESSPLSNKKLSLREIVKLPMTFWIYTLIPLLYYLAINPFLSIAQTFVIQKYSFTAESASRMNGLIYAIPSIFFPVFGCVINHIGYKMYWGFLSVLLVLAGQCIYCFSGPDSYFPYISTVAFGISFIVFCCTVWTFGLLLVKQQQVATAYGIAYALYNIGQTSGLSLTGVIVDNFGYFLAELVFFNIACLCLLVLFVLYFVDCVFNSGELNKPGWKTRKPTARPT